MAAVKVSPPPVKHIDETKGGHESLTIDGKTNLSALKHYLSSIGAVLGGSKETTIDGFESYLMSSPTMAVLRAVFSLRDPPVTFLPLVGCRRGAVG